MGMMNISLLLTVAAELLVFLDQTVLSMVVLRTSLDMTKSWALQVVPISVKSTSSSEAGALERTAKRPSLSATRKDTHQRSLILLGIGTLAPILIFSSVLGTYQKVRF